MKISIRHIHALLLLLALAALNHPLPTAFAQGTAFTYQGRLNDGGGTANGSYDLTFTLFSTNLTGTAVAGPLTNSATAVSNGLFTATLDFGGVFNGANYWLEIGVRTNGSGTFTTLAPRQKITPTPYAITAESLVGTGTNNIVQPGSTASVIAGGQNNLIGASSVDATIPRGEQNKIGMNAGAATVGGGYGNVIGDVSGSSTIAGGWGNTVSNSSAYSTIGGGINNGAGTESTIGGGNGNIAVGLDATVGGGLGNNASGERTTVGGGEFNIASGYGAVVGGGSLNQATGPAATVGGGEFNHASGYNAAVGGGYANTASGNGAFIGGGGYDGVTLSANLAGGSGSVIGGGIANSTSGLDSVVAGGRDNHVTNDYAMIPGGLLNTAGGQFSFAAGHQAKALHDGTFVWADSIAADLASTSTNQFLIRAGGGVGINTPSPTSALHVKSSSSDCEVSVESGDAGAHRWTIQSSGSAYGALGKFQIIDRTAVASRLSIATNGNVGIATSTPQSALDVNGEIHWGTSNVLSVNQSGSIELGNSLQAGAIPFIDFHYGTGSAQDFNLRIINSGDQQLDILRSGSATPLARFNSGALTVNGTFVSTSDRNAKEHFQPVNAQEVLTKVASLPLSRWNYKEDKSQQHLGPMAQDFYAAFNVGPDDKHITTVDEGGVALAAIQGLNQKLEETRAENAELKQSVAELKKLVESLVQRK